MLKGEAARAEEEGNIMSRRLTRKELRRFELIHRLQQNRDKQITGRLQKEGGFCAMGVAREILREHGMKVSERACCDRIGHAFGMPYRQTKRVVRMNEEGKTFPEIAEQLRKWPVFQKPWKILWKSVAFGKMTPPKGCV